VMFGFTIWTIDCNLLMGNFFIKLKRDFFTGINDGERQA
jgi:hypothetical protein